MHCQRRNEPFKRPGLSALSRWYAGQILAMKPDELREAIAFGREQRGVEFKGPGRRDNPDFMAKVARAILGMANTEDGGVVVLGVAEEGLKLVELGLGPDAAATWNHDHVHGWVQNYADPYVEFEVEIVVLDAKNFVAISVRPFDESPIICKKDHQESKPKGSPSGSPSWTLRQGTLYYRGRGKNETVAVSNHVEMREILTGEPRRTSQAGRRAFTSSSTLLAPPRLLMCIRSWV